MWPGHDAGAIHRSRKVSAEIRDRVPAQEPGVTVALLVSGQAARGCQADSPPLEASPADQAEARRHGRRTAQTEDRGDLTRRVTSADSWGHGQGRGLQWAGEAGRSAHHPAAPPPLNTQLLPPY